MRRRRWRRYGSVVRAGARGAVAAMAMTGLRTVTAAAVPRQESPPAAIVEEHAPPRVRKMTKRRREAFTEIFHWVYGSCGGMLFGLLPDRVRGRLLAGPAYGLTVWLGYELVVGPVLGVEHSAHRRETWRAAVALDHLLYGVVVAGRLAPEPTAVTRRRRFPRLPGCGA
ncbi:hypothetical protein [Actinomadura algeriensis]|uniref:DUF1440 domain-containing protein n=1 Tax=Actinomadura algeriensis TaxID=1679523 RepID=A0ABR9JNQ3_9ACTN|nr:hypothetical protein [Actinomadura algeriensis]MBE1532193.1 hypothetical protein [Actinomadura algeriensis]